MTGINNNKFLVELLDLQQDGKQAISAPANWATQEPLLEVLTDIDTVVQELGNSILIGSNGNKVARWHFLIGSPGNGKSAATGKLCKFLEREYGCSIKDGDGNPLEEIGQSAVPYSLSIYECGNKFSSAMIVQDASVVRDPYAVNVDPAMEFVVTLNDAWEKGISLVVCTNRGVLDKAFQDLHNNPSYNTKQWFKILKKVVSTEEITSNMTFNGNDRHKCVFDEVNVSYNYLDNRSLLLNSDIFNSLILKAINDPSWTACSDCEVISLCPFKANRDWLANEDAKANFLTVMKRVEVFSGQIIVFREALALISLILAGCPRDYKDGNPCQWVRDKVSANDVYSLAMRRIYMCVFASSSPYGLEIDSNLQNKQRYGLSMLSKLLEHDGNEDKPQYIVVMLKGNPPSQDVGVGRLTGVQGKLTEIDPWRECLPAHFVDRWDGDLSVVCGDEHPLFTEIERLCTKEWAYLVELIESTSSHEASQCHRALRRWSSNFLIHFGGLLEGLTCWGEELDEFIEILGIIDKNISERSIDDKRKIREMSDRLETLLATGFHGTAVQDTVQLSEAVDLSGSFVSRALRPKICSSRKSGSLSITVEFNVIDDVPETALISANAFLWLSKHEKGRIDTRCFPQELLRGVIDARIRAASNGKYATVPDDVNLIIKTIKKEKFTISRFDGDVDIAKE